MKAFEKLDKMYNDTQALMRKYAYSIFQELGSMILAESAPITVRSERNGYKPLIEYIEVVVVLEEYPHYKFVAETGYEYYPEDIRPEELWELLRAIKEGCK